MTEVGIARRHVRQDGYLLSYQEAGPAEAGVVVLVHGLLSDSTTWQPAMAELAARGLRVIAPDLLGHGESDKPAHGRYTLEDFAASLQALLCELGIEQATIGGHSLGGGTSIAFAHRHPERVERLVLVASGGFGTELHPVLRGATLPGARTLLRLALNERTARLYSGQRLHRSLGLSPESVENLARIGRGITSPEGRAAFFATLTGSIDAAGQRGSMLDLGYVDAELPTLLVWSEHDPIIPVEHAHVAAQFLRAGRLELFPGSSHEPHRRHHERFAEVVADFIATT